MKRWFRINWIFIILLAFGLFLLFYGIWKGIDLDKRYMYLPPTQITPYYEDVTFLEAPEINPELYEALKSKSETLEVETAGLIALTNSMAIEIKDLIAENAELRGNQQPNLEKDYTTLKNKYNSQTVELNALKIDYDKLTAEYESLVNLHANCDVCED